MKKEYDFSRGVRGKFYKSGSKLHIPVYLNPENCDFVQNIARKKKKDISSVVNELLKGDKELAEAIG
jgi:hypothetical protein